MKFDFLMSKKIRLNSVLLYICLEIWKKCTGHIIYIRY